MAGMLRNMATSVTVKRTRVHRLVLHLDRAAITAIHFFLIFPTTTFRRHGE